MSARSNPAKAQSSIAVIGIDIGKNVFHVIGLDAHGAISLKAKVCRTQLAVRLANLPPCLIGMEACVGAHHLSRRLIALGHDARMMPAAYARAFVKTNKNDWRDAEGIAEAVQRPTMRFVAPKTTEQLDLQALHRVRERLVRNRTATVNEIRSFLLDRGIAVETGIQRLRRALPEILAARADELTPRMLRVIEGLTGDWRQLDARIDEVTSEIERLAHDDAACKTLMSVPGIGPIISSATVSAIGNGDMFERGRDFGAWLGLVPQQRSTGGRTILGKISKRGNSYLRKLFVQGARSVLMKPASWERYGLKPWISAAQRRMHSNKLAVALAHKLARIAWSVLKYGRNFEFRSIHDHDCAQPA